MSQPIEAAERVSLASLSAKDLGQLVMSRAEVHDQEGNVAVCMELSPSKTCMHIARRGMLGRFTPKPLDQLFEISF